MIDFIIIGGGQAGLAMAYELKQLKKEYLVLDANSETGATWLKRWDSLQLFTPSEFNHLPGLKFPSKKGYYPNKYDVATYLKSYVETFNIPITFNTKIEDLKKEGTYFVLKSATKIFKAKHVVVATGPFHKPFTPKFHTKIASHITQIHSEHYKNPQQLKTGPTLIVGSGDSGVQILNEISNTDRTVYFSGDTNILSIPQEILGKTLWWWFKKIGFLSVNKFSFIGKKLSKGVQPIIGTDVKSVLKKENIVCVGRTLDAFEETLTFEKGSYTDIKNVVWATGFKPNFGWIKGITLNASNYPKNYRGISDIEGLYFLGLPWLYTRGSATLGGVKKDTKFISNYIKTLEAKPTQTTIELRKQLA